MSTTILTQETVDLQTGEIFTKTVFTKNVETKEQFIRTYTEDVLHLCRCSGAETRIVLALLPYVEYNTNQFFLTKSRKEDIGVITNTTMNTINSSISRLMKKNVVIKLSSNTFMLNPKLFFYGTDVERNKIFSLAISYVLK